MIFIGHLSKTTKGKEALIYYKNASEIYLLQKVKDTFWGCCLEGMAPLPLKLSRSPSPHAMGKESDGRKEVHVITARFSSISPRYTVLDSLGTMSMLPTSLYFSLFILKMDIIKHM